MQNSSYYPPRARWYSRSVYWSNTLQRRLVLNRIHLPRGVAFGRLVCGVLLPGFGFAERIPRVWAAAISGFCLLLVLVFFVWLGRPLGNAAFTLLLSIHATGLGCLLEPWLKGSRLRFRIFISMAVFFALGGLLYLPARNLIQDHWLLPLQVHGRTIIIHKLASLARVERGEWLAYSFSGNYDGNIIVRGGIGLSRLLGKAGDRVGFTGAALEVNGAVQSHLPFMPVTGEWIVPEKHWFVWPETAIDGHGYVPGDAVSSTLLQIGTISDEQVIGIPFKYWFWWNNAPK